MVVTSLVDSCKPAESLTVMVALTLVPPSLLPLQYVIGILSPAIYNMVLFSKFLGVPLLTF